MQTVQAGGKEANMNRKEQKEIEKQSETYTYNKRNGASLSMSSKVPLGMVFATQDASKMRQAGPKRAQDALETFPKGVKTA